METPNAETTPETPAPTVTYSPEQQAHLEKLIREVQGRAAADLRAENKRLQAELAAAKSTTATPDLSRDLELSRAELAALRTEQAQTKLDAQLRQAAGNMFLDTDLAVRVMKDNIRVASDGKATVVDADGNVMLDAQLSPMSLAGLAQRVANERKYLARGEVKYGAGSVLAERAPTTQQVKLEDLFGPQSKGALANALALKSPSEYRRLKTLARQKGLV